MKKVCFLALTLVLFFSSCNQKGKDSATDFNGNRQDSTVTHNDSMGGDNPATAVDKDTVLYACPMHPEVQGKKDEKCSKCGMKLTEPVSEKAEEK